MIVGGCSNQSSNIFQEFVDRHGQIPIGLMTNRHWGSSGNQLLLKALNSHGTLGEGVFKLNPDSDQSPFFPYSIAILANTQVMRN